MDMKNSRITNSLLRMLGMETVNDINSYVMDVVSRNFVVMNSMEHIQSIFGDSFYEFLNGLSEEEIMDLRTWTSYNFVDINAILRGNWNHWWNGVLTSDKEKQLRQTSDRLSSVIDRYNTPDMDFVVFRGATLTSFAGYGVTSLLDLKKLKGGFLYELGFTSTSLLRDSSYFGKDLNNGKNYNVEIRYLIPSESNDGVLLTSNDTSHYNEEVEYLINKGSLSKVIDVEVDEVENKAYLTIMLIPKKVYDMTQQMGKKGSKNI